MNICELYIQITCRHNSYVGFQMFPTVAADSCLCCKTIQDVSVLLLGFHFTILLEQCRHDICIYTYIDREIDRQRDRELDSQIDRQTDRQTDRQIDRSIDRQIDIYIYLYLYRQIVHRQIDRQIDRYIDRQTNRQIDSLIC